MPSPARSQLRGQPGNSLSAAGPGAFADPDSDIAAKREAFIAAERARRAEGGHASPAYSAHDAIPARRRREDDERPARNPSPEAARRAQRRGSSGSGLSSAKPYSKIFGHPDKRMIMVGYVLWYFSGLLSVHRIYCGNLEGAMYQIALLIGTLVCLAIFPPLGLVGFVVWMLWLFADLFTLPRHDAPLPRAACLQSR